MPGRSSVTRRYVTIEFCFETSEPQRFSDELEPVFNGIEFVDRFDSDTRCLSFTITDVY